MNDMLVAFRKLVFGYTDSEKKLVEENFRRTQKRIEVNKNYNNGKYDPFLSWRIEDKNNSSIVYQPKVNNDSLLVAIGLGILVIIILK